MTTTEALNLIEACGKQLCTEFAIDEQNRQPVTTVAAWLAREGRQGMDLNKGLLLVGNVGSGKTLLMRSVRAAMQQAYGSQFGLRPCAEMVRAFSDGGYGDIEGWMTAPHVCFDDLGTESEAVHYGKRTNLMAEVIEARYDRLQSGRKCWTHLTTNLGTDQIRDRYGERAFSRLRHMTNLVDLGAGSVAKDRRQTATAPAFKPEPVNADNVYTAVHPDIASRILAMMPPRVKTLRIDREPVERPTQESDVARFVTKIKSASEQDLRAAKDYFIKSYPEAECGPYLRAIDAELQSRPVAA